jgi:hypothetical protein
MRAVPIALFSILLAICTARSDNLRIGLGFQTQSCGKWTELRRELAERDGEFAYRVKSAKVS